MPLLLYISELTKITLETFEGTAGDVDQDLTGDKAYEYNHVTVTGLEPEHNLLLYSRKKWSADRRMLNIQLRVQIP